MTSKAPIFPMAEPQHYSDYGFDAQIDYFQVLHETRRHSKRDARPLETFRFKLQKPISKDDSRRSSRNKKKSSKWWRNALLFFKRKRQDRGGAGQAHHHRTAAAAPYSSAAFPSSVYAYPYNAVSSPVYTTESGGDASWTPCRWSGGGGWTGNSSGSLSLTETGEMKVPYLCLRDVAAMDASPTPSSAACPSPAMPIYLVT